MRVVVTGAAGFIGGHLAQALLERGHTVVGIDCLTDYYDVTIKRSALTVLARYPAFTHVPADLATADLAEVLDGVDVVYHLAGQPGVHLSWADGFSAYVERNIVATQRLLEAARAAGVTRLVYASSSSVYGNTTQYPTTEAALPTPYSPYGVTKLAGEHLCALYSANWGVPTLALRYFTVYGPRQRPDMGIFKFLHAAAHDRALPIFGDGEQLRDFTFVADVVAANLAALDADVPPGTFLNIAGGDATSVNQLLSVIETVVQKPLEIRRMPDQPGDVRATGGSIERARTLLGWEPVTKLLDGVTAQWQWQSELTPTTGSGPAGAP